MAAKDWERNLRGGKIREPGQIWLYTFRPPDKPRPVLILSRPDVIPLLSTMILALVDPD